MNESVPRFEHEPHRVRWSRIAPFGQLACQVLVAGALLRHVLAPVALAPVQRVLIALAMIAAIAVTAKTLHAPLVAVTGILVALALLAASLTALENLPGHHAIAP